MRKGVRLKANFSTGFELHRCSTLPLTHAWLAEGPDVAYPGGRWRLYGFSRSAEQAAKNMDSECRFRFAHDFTRDLAEVVPVVPV